MAYKLEKFGVSAECILIQCNKAVCCSFAFKEHICFYLFSCAIVVKTAVVVCVNFLQWSVELITSFIDFMEMFVGVLPSHIYQPYATEENPIPVLPEPCPLRYRPAFIVCASEPLASPPPPPPTLTNPMHVIW